MPHQQCWSNIQFLYPVAFGGPCKRPSTLMVKQFFLTLGVVLKFLDAMSHTGWLYSSHVPGGLLTFEQNSTILNKCNVYKAVCLQCLEKSPVLKFRDCLVSLCGCPETLRVHIVSAVQFSKGKKKKAWGNVWAGFLAPELCSEKY